jgi:histidine triad (HIT) family protein
MENCLFCRIIQGEIPSDKVYEDEAVYAFRDISPQAPTHVLVVPKEHVTSVDSANNPLKVGTVILKAAEIAKNEGLSEKGYRLVCNHGPDGGQTVFHLHVHVLGGRSLDWPPG